MCNPERGLGDPPAVPHGLLRLHRALRSLAAGREKERAPVKTSEGTLELCTIGPLHKESRQDALWPLLTLRFPQLEA